MSNNRRYSLSIHLRNGINSIVPKREKDTPLLDHLRKLPGLINLTDDAHFLDLGIVSIDQILGMYLVSNGIEDFYDKLPQCLIPEERAAIAKYCGCQVNVSPQQLESNKGFVGQNEWKGRLRSRKRNLHDIDE